MTKRCKCVGSRMLSVVLGGALVAGAVYASGCSSKVTSASLYAQIRDNPTPELQTLTKTKIDIQNMYTVTFDENIREMREECQRLLLLDRPSHLSRYPMP